MTSPRFSLKKLVYLILVGLLAAITSTTVEAQTRQYATWTSIVNGTNLGNGSLHKTSTGTWDFSATATQTLLAGDGYVEATAANYNQSITLSGSGGDRSIIIGSGGWAGIYENGVEVAGTYGHPPAQTFSPHASGDRYRIEITNGVLRYIRYRSITREILFTSTAALPTYPLSLSLGMSPQNAEWQRTVVAQLNRKSTWSSITNGIDLGNGSVRKTSTGTWDFSAISSQTLLRGDGYFESTASYFNQQITAAGTDGKYGSIVIGTGGWVGIYENDVEVAGTVGHGPSQTFGAHAAGDRYRLEITSGKLSYVRYRGGVRTLLYTSANALPAYPLGFSLAASFQNSEWQNSVFAQLTLSVSWSSITNGTDLGSGSVRKTSTGTWDFSANVAQLLTSGNGFFESTTSYYNQLIAANGIDGVACAIIVGTGGWAAIYENGVEVAGTVGHPPNATFGAHAAGDRYRLEITGGKLRYVRYRSDVRTILYTSTGPLPAYPLLFNVGASFQNSEWQSSIFNDNVPEHNDAAFVSQTVPTSMTPGQNYNVSVTMRNTGASTWKADGDYQLASDNLPDNQRWGLNRVNLTAAVLPGSDAVFNFTVTAPTTPGAYSFQWRMIQPGVQRFGALSTNVNVQTVNNPPTVSLTAPLNSATFTAGSNITLTATATDSDGTISKVEFFQGTVKLAEDTTFPYSFTWNNVAAGGYMLTAKATDNGGAIATSDVANITVIAPNQPPVANTGGPYSGTTLTAIQFNGGGSSDPDGIISSYQWNFGDNGSGSGATPTHSYAIAGTYTVTLTVTDNAGATNTASTTATISNRPPVANTGGPYTGITLTAVQFNGGSSSDADGTISGYAWNFGDSTTGSGVTPTHTYSASGTFTVTLTVTDNNGATNTATTTATISNRAPVANAGGPYSGVTSLAVQFNGSGSSDADGTITGYAWNFGDGANGTGATPTHAYSTAGTKTVTLTVTDNNGTTNSASTTVTISGFSEARLDPLNRTGNAGDDPLSQNFNWSLPLVKLPGRAGLDLGLSLTYNSLATWTKNGGYISYDDDQGSPAPGFRLGFPVIQPIFHNSQANKDSYLLITTSGARLELRQVATNLYQAVDSSYLLLDTSNNQMKLRAMDGTKLTYTLMGNSYACTEVKDRNGNFITVNYLNGRIDTVIDTLARTIQFVYTGADLTSITQSWKINGQNQTHTWASFAYANKDVLPSFTGVTVLGPPNNSIRALTQVTLADNSHYEFEYTAWGQIWKISHFAVDDAVTQHLLNYRAYNLRGSPMLATGTEADCPRFTERHDWAEYWNRDANGVAQESVTRFIAPASVTIPGTNLTGSLAQVIVAENTPQQLTQKLYFGSTATLQVWKKGLLLLSETYDNNAFKQRWVTTAWTQDDENVAYCLNPRVIETNVFDALDHRARTRIDYASFTLADTTTIHLPQDTYEYQADASNVLRRRRTDYQMDPAFANQHIIGLPSAQYLCDATQGEVPCDTNSGASLMSKVTFQYDEPGSVQPTATPVQHDNDNYAQGSTLARGNLSSVTRYNVSNSQTTMKRMQYNTAGAPVNVYDEVDHLTQISYTDAFAANGTTVDTGLPTTLAYPTTITDPDNKTVKSRYRYDFGALTWKQTPLPNVTDNQDGPQKVWLYDPMGRLERVKSLFDTSYTRYVYGPNYVETLATVNNLVDEALSLQVFDGAGRVIGKASNHPGSSGGFSGELLFYDQLGQLVKSSNPTETSVTILGMINAYGWTAAGDDEAGWIYTQQTYDWKGRPLVTISPSITGNPNDTTTQEASYSGCGCAGTEITTLSDEGTIFAGELKRRQQKIYTDVLGRAWKTENLNYDGSVYSTNVSVYDVRDQVTSVMQYVGAAPSDASSTNTNVSCPSGTCQKTTMEYDGYGRLKNQHLPEQQADPNNSATTDHRTWTYNNDDTIASTTDARGATTSYVYNGRHLILNLNYSAPAGVATTPNVTFVYDGAGNRKSMADGLGTINYNYNDLSRLTSEVRQFTDPNSPFLSGSFTLSYDYNFAGQVKSVTDPFGSTVSYVHDQVGQVTSVNGSGGGATSYASGLQYRAWGALKHLTYGNSLTVDLTYNNRLDASQYDLKTAGGARVMGLQYQYDNSDHLVSSTDLADPNLNRSYGFDNVARLSIGGSGTGSNFSGPYSQTYGYDVWGNLTTRSWRTYQQTPFGTFPFTNNSSTTYVNNRNTMSGWQYDPDGHLLASVEGSLTLNYTYDAVGNLVTVSKTGLSIADAYDGDGLKLKHNENGAFTYYLSSSVVDDGPIVEINQSGQKLRGYVYAGGQVLAKQENGQVFWDQRDPSDSSMRLTNSAGTVTSRVETDPLDTQVDTSSTYNFSGSTGYVANPSGFYGNPSDPTNGCRAGGNPSACAGVLTYRPYVQYFVNNEGRLDSRVIFIPTVDSPIFYPQGPSPQSSPTPDGKACDERLKSIFGDQDSAFATDRDPPEARSSRGRNRLGVDGEDPRQGVAHLYARPTGEGSLDAYAYTPPGFFGSTAYGYDRPLPAGGSERQNDRVYNYAPGSLQNYGYSGGLQINFIHTGPTDVTMKPLPVSHAPNDRGSVAVGVIGGYGNVVNGQVLNPGGNGQGGGDVHVHMKFYEITIKRDKKGRLKVDKRKAIDPRKVFCKDLGFT